MFDLRIVKPIFIIQTFLFFCASMLAAEDYCKIKIQAIDSETKKEIDIVRLRIINYDDKTLYDPLPFDPTSFESVSSGNISVTANRFGYSENIVRRKLVCPAQGNTVTISVSLTPKTTKKPGQNKRTDQRLTRLGTRSKLPTSDSERITSERVVSGKATRMPKPSYPRAARAVRASGSVRVRVVIGTDGNVISVMAVDGHPLLRRAAERAAVGATFQTTLLDNKPVEVTGIIVYNFRP